ncbi:MAG: SusC/RagA family TonB-linked outer membrane protein [Dinghuibacter sp.]|nr:SusC/RagA family TonB-linked outer membrane protein [Dinghuibacter sp.]
MLFVLLLPAWIFAQTVVTGRVTDGSGNPLPRASVSVKGASGVTLTDADGKFSINVANSNAKLVVSYVGFVTQTVDASNSNTIVLAVDNTNLSEVVVTGLATSIKRSNAANSVGTISAKQLTGNTRPQTLDGAMQGKIAGAQISANSGAPGGGFSVRLRGISSINLSSEPLYIIDGVYVNNDQNATGAGTGPFSGATGQTSGTQDQAPNRLADINPADIENISILKGPSAAAIYGTRANAGVVIITTKRGKAGKISVNVGQDFGIARALNLIGMHKTIWDRQFTFGTDKASGADYTAEKAAKNPTNQTWDYEDIIYGNTGFISNTRVSLSGGTEKLRYYAGASRWDETGIQKRTGYQRNSVRLNLDFQPKTWWDIGVSTNILVTESDRSFSGNDNNGVSLGYTLAYVPNWLPQLPVNGVYPTNKYTGQNPLEIVDKGVNNEQVNRYIVSFNNTFNLIRKDNHTLKLSMQGGLDQLHQENFVHMMEELQYQQQRANPGAVRNTSTRTRNVNMQAFLVDNYQHKELGFTTSVGAVRLEVDNKSIWFQGEGMPRGTTNTTNASVQLSNLFLSSWQDVGLVAQEEINWGDKIIATFGIRADKSSLNGDATKFYGFKKASLAVNLTNFDFWNVSAINLLKFRTAYGETGNPPAFGSKFTNVVPFAIDNVTGSSTPATVGNPAIKPETSQELEFGMDFAALKNRVTGEISYYTRKIKDFIDVFNLSPGTGVTSYKAFNVGEIENKGWEVSLGGVPVQKKNIRWSTNFNWWQNRSEITKLSIPEKATAATGFGAFGTQRLRVGNSPSQWYGTPNNANGLPTAYEDAQPKWQLSWSNTVTFLKNFEFSMLLHRSHKNFNSSLNGELTDEGGTSPDWSVPDKNGDPSGATRILGQPGITTRQFIQDASFTKLREVSLYYTIPRNTLNKWGFLKNIEQAKIGFSGNNLFVWTNYYGYDPEGANFGNRPTLATVDLLSFPSVRRMYFHINVNF